MAEAQAVDRVHRIGQTRGVRITRYCVKGSIEEASLLSPTFSGYIILTRVLVHPMDPGQEGKND
jgi:hypothetical protein